MIDKNIFKNYINNLIMSFLRKKNEKVIRFIKIKTPIFEVLSKIIFRKEIKESSKIYFLLKENMSWNNFSPDKRVILNFQKKKLKYILEYAYNHSIYYKKLFDENCIDIKNLSNFYNIPLLDKEIIRKNKTQLICKNIYKTKFYIMNTGGSTGEPMEFPVSYLAGFADKIHQQFIFEMIGYVKGDKIFAFDGSTVPKNLRDKNKYWIIKNRKDIPYGRLSYSSLYLNKNTIKYYVAHLLDSKPSIIRGYPSFINEIAVYLLENEIKVNFMIKGIQLTAENTFGWQIKNIKKAFNTNNIFFQYGHSEVCIYAFTKDNNCEYYCSPFYGLTEVIGVDGKHVRRGEVGEVVATSFYNMALPFIRYRTGDLALFNGEDDDGISRLKKIMGRAQDYLYNKNGEKILITGIVFGQHYHAFRNIKKWQIQQNKPGEIIINLVRGEKFSLKDKEEIINKFKNIAGIDVKFNFVDKFKLTKRGKFKFVVVNFRP